MKVPAYDPVVVGDMLVHGDHGQAGGEASQRHQQPKGDAETSWFRTRRPNTHMNWTISNTQRSLSS
jgi:hypothetical protein